MSTLSCAVTADVASVTSEAPPQLHCRAEHDQLSRLLELKKQVAALLRRHFPRKCKRSPEPTPWGLAEFIRERKHLCPVFPWIDTLYREYVGLKSAIASSHIGLAIKLASKYCRFRRNRPVDRDDLIQEAYTGLLIAIDRFEPVRRTRLSTYAAFWIRQTLQVALAKSAYVVSLSPHQVRRLARYNARGELGAHREGRLLRIEELADAYGADQERLRELDKAARNGIALESTTFDEETTTIAVTDDTTLVHRMRNEHVEHIMRLIARLDERERDVISLRYGLQDGLEHSLRQIAKALKISKERVRQIETTAIQKLRMPAIEFEVDEDEVVEATQTTQGGKLYDF